MQFFLNAQFRRNVVVGVYWGMSLSVYSDDHISSEYIDEPRVCQNCKFATKRISRNIPRSVVVGIFRWQNIRRKLVFPMNSVLGRCCRNVVGSSSQCIFRVRQNIVGISFIFSTKWYRRPLSSEIRQNMSIPTNFWRFFPSVSACFLVVFVVKTHSNIMTN